MNEGLLKGLSMNASIQYGLNGGSFPMQCEDSVTINIYDLAQEKSAPLHCTVLNAAQLTRIMKQE